ncbi:hypothetical protein BDR04DRAFT_1094131 [Suillus decipiens]|nr:hypothetical protein BDR04DRAFT_1094131 [Suillus decipiens]
MRFSILAVVIALTASMYVSAQCGYPGDSCNPSSPDACCGDDVCAADEVSMSRLLCNQD